MTIADIASPGSASARDRGSTSPASSPSPISNLAARIVVSRATELAREGQYGDAESLLAALLPANMPALGLDLLARIRAQQGRFPEAKALWLQISQLDPGDPGARAALERIAKRESRDRAGTARGRPVGRGENHATPERETATAGRASEKSEELRVRVPGAVLQKVDNEVLVTFDFSLFSGAGAQLENRAKSALSILGWQLEPYVGNIAIEVVGQPDALPQDGESLPRDVAALGMDRAVAVFNHLIETTKLQSRMFTLRTGEDFLLVDDSDSEEGNASNSPILLR
ncbi:MAG: hypothetical protein FJ276_20800, partial [Planctomycetes bacterium]|nr:hypothetical protein [Planctomycetota bacterium]